MAATARGFAKYVEQPTPAQVGHEDYAASPGTALLKYLVEAKDSVSLCVRYFRTKSDGTWTKNSNDSLQHIVTAMLPAIMGHFETYQRYLFAGMFDRSIHLRGFDMDAFVSRLSNGKNAGRVSIDPRRLGAHRGLGVDSVGLMLGDALPGWHDPSTVNTYFDAFGLQRKFLHAHVIPEIMQLWQLRHSVVHTGGTLTLADAQKVPSLSHLGRRRLAFQSTFISELARRLHPIVHQSTTNIGSAYRARVLPETTNQERDAIDQLFTVESSVKAWLPS